MVLILILQINNQIKQKKKPWVYSHANKTLFQQILQFNDNLKLTQKLILLWNTEINIYTIERALFN